MIIPAIRNMLSHYRDVDGTSTTPYEFMMKCVADAHQGIIGNADLDSAIRNDILAFEAPHEPQFDLDSLCAYGKISTHFNSCIILAKADNVVPYKMDPGYVRMIDPFSAFEQVSGKYYDMYGYGTVLILANNIYTIPDNDDLIYDYIRKIYEIFSLLARLHSNPGASNLIGLLLTMRYMYRYQHVNMLDNEKVFANAMNGSIKTDFGRTLFIDEYYTLDPGMYEVYNKMKPEERYALLYKFFKEMNVATRFLDEDTISSMPVYTGARNRLWRFIQNEIGNPNLPVTGVDTQFKYCVDLEGKASTVDQFYPFWNILGYIGIDRDNYDEEYHKKIMTADLNSIGMNKYIIMNGVYSRIPMAFSEKIIDSFAAFFIHNEMSKSMARAIESFLSALMLNESVGIKQHPTDNFINQYWFRMLMAVCLTHFDDTDMKAQELYRHVLSTCVAAFTVNIARQTFGSDADITTVVLACLMPSVIGADSIESLSVDGMRVKLSVLSKSITNYVNGLSVEIADRILCHLKDAARLVTDHISETISVNCDHGDSDETTIIDG